MAPPPDPGYHAVPAGRRPEGPAAKRAIGPWILGLWVALLLGPALGSAAFAAPPRPVRFKSADGVDLKADFVKPGKGRPVLVLLHGLGAGRGEWAMLQATLASGGWGSLALDARGHGESGGPSYTSFGSPSAWLALEKDLEAGLRFLNEEGYPSSRLILAGASLGANLTLRVAARERKVPFAVLFSPGVDYQGVRVDEALLGFERPILFAAAPDDRYAYASAREMLRHCRNPKSRFLPAASGHGAQMLADGAFLKELLGAMEGLAGKK